MSEQLERIFAKYKKLFGARQDEIKDFLLKHYKQVFKQQLVEDVDRIDSTSRIKTAGFQKNLASWRNTYQNIIVSSCEVIKGKQKRYDYKFLFVKEKLDDKTVQIIEDGLDEASRMARRFNFDEAIIKVDEMIDLIRKEKDEVYNKRLYDFRKQIATDKEKYEKGLEQIRKLEEKVKECQEKGDLKGVIANSEKIVQIANSIKRKDIAKKYSDLAEKAKSDLETLKEIERLDKRVRLNRTNERFVDALTNCEKIIEHAESINRDDLVEKYTKLKEDIQQDIENTLKKIAELEESFKRNRENNDLKAALNDCLKIIKLAKSVKRDDLVEKYAKLKDELKKEISLSKEEYDNILKDLRNLEKEFKKNRESGDLKAALDNCQQIIELADSIDKPELVSKYSKLYEQIMNELTADKDKGDELLEELARLEDIIKKNVEDKKFKEVLSNYDKAIQIAESLKRQDLVEKYQKLKEYNKKQMEAAEDLARLLKELEELDKRIKNDIDDKNFVEALSNCDKAIQITEALNRPDLVEKYLKLRGDIEKRMEGVEDLDKLLRELEELDNEIKRNLDDKKFPEALSNCDKVIQIAETLKRQDLVEKYQKLKEYNKKQMEAAEDLARLLKELEELDKRIKNDIDDKNFVEALSNCDKAIQITEALNRPDLVKKYAKLKEDIKKQMETAEGVDKYIEELEELDKKIKKNLDDKNFAEAMSNCDKVIQIAEALKRTDLVEKYTKLKEDIKKQMGTAEELDKLPKQLDELDKKIKKNLENKKFAEALSNCDKAIQISESLNRPDLVEKYNNLKEDIKRQMETAEELDKLLRDLKELDKLIKKDIKDKNFAEAMSNCDKAIQISGALNRPDLVEKYQKLKEDIKNRMGAEESDKLLQELKELDKIIKKNVKNENFSEALSNCDRAIQIAEALNRSDLVEKYLKLRGDIEKRMEGVEDLDKLLRELEELDNEIKKNLDDKKFPEALSNCDKVIQIAETLNRPDLVEKYQKLKEDIKKQMEATESLDKLLKELEELEKNVKKNLDDNALGEALKNCNRIIEIAEIIDRPDLIEKYTQLKEQIEKELEEQETRQVIMIKAKEVEKMVGIEKDVLPLIEEFSVDDILGDISGDITDSLQQIDAILDEHRAEVKEEVVNKAVLVSASGEVAEIEKNIKVEKAADDESPIYNIQSGIENPFDDVIEEAIITDLIPYDYEIVDMELNGKPVEELPDKTLTKDGLELKWTLQNIQPKERVDINYNLRRRIIRTIIFVLKDRLKIVKTYADINPLEIEGLHEAKLPFTNSSRKALQSVIIEDLIPLYYIHFVKAPRDILPDNESKFTHGELVKWNIGTMKKGTLNYHYKLLELYKFEELKIIIHNLDNVGYDALKKNDGIQSIVKYKEIVNELEDFVK